METHAPIRRTLSSPEGLARVSAILAKAGSANRTEIARRVCEAFGFRDDLGGLRGASCLAALRALESAGLVTLPAAERGGGDGGLARLGAPVAFPLDVPERAGLIRDLRLIPVSDPELGKLFNEMMAREHPRGAARHVGTQLRYLAESSQGWLGGLLFTPATRVLRARDEWIGWDAEARERHLPLALCLARFLVRPRGCRMLASRLLGMALRRLPGDFEERYGRRPVVVETYVDPTYAGTCLLATGWRPVGRTSGRRRRRGVAEAPKAVFLRPLTGDWRRSLGVAPAFPQCRLDAGRWAEIEFGGAPLGDRRLSRRLVQCAAAQARAPSRSFLGAAAGNEALMKGYYRLIEHPDYDAVSPEAILAMHRRQTLRRMSEQRVVLLIQDGSDVSYASHPGCEGLGRIGRNRGSQGTLGLHLHSTLAVGNDGVPLGVPRIEFDAPPLGAGEPAEDVEDRKTGRWLRGLRDSAEMARRLDGVQVVAVMDREGDGFDVFREPRHGIALLIRACHNRSLGDGLPKLFEHLRRQPARAFLRIGVDRLSARNSTRGQKASQGRETRNATVALRWTRVELPVPKASRSRLGTEAETLNAVDVFETEAPRDGSDPVSWRLLTTLRVETEGDARKVIELYALRWRIEDWHRILKSGCKIGRLAHQSAGRMERAIAINAVIAWRIAALTQLGRTRPDLPPETAFSDLELAILKDLARTQNRPMPSDLGSAFLLVASLGGYLNRPNDPPPGHETTWHGQSALSFAAWILSLSRDLGENSELGATLKLDTRYG